MAQKRIYQIAKELNISHVEIINFLKDKGVEVANHMAPVDNNTYDSILLEFSKEKASIERLRKERARQAIIENKEDVDSKLKPEIPNIKSSPIIKEEIKEDKPNPSSEKENKESVDKSEAQDSTTKKSESISSDAEESPPVKKKAGGRKLKKIDMSTIADKINVNKKSKFKKADITSSNTLPVSKKNKKRIKKKKVEEKKFDCKNKIEKKLWTTVEKKFWQTVIYAYSSNKSFGS